MAGERDCRQHLERIFAYLDAELDARSAAELERHLQDCPCCGALAEGLRRTIAACRVAGAPPVPKAVQARARARVKALIGAAGRDRPSR